MTTRRPRISKPAAKAVRAIAKAAVRKEAEDKFVGVQLLHNFNSTINSAGECYSLVPQVTIGTGDYQRIGDKIRGKYLYIKGTIQIDGSVMATLDKLPASTVRALILTQKNIKVGSDVSSRVDVAHLLKDNIGTGTARQFVGSQFDAIAPINKDLFRVHMDRKFKFNWENQQQPDTATGVPTTTWQSGNNRTKSFTCRIKCPNTLTFDDGNGSWPNNFAPFFCLGSVSDDGAAVFSVTTPWKVAVQSVMYYEDA